MTPPDARQSPRALGQRPRAGAKLGVEVCLTGSDTTVRPPIRPATAPPARHRHRGALLLAVLAAVALVVLVTPLVHGGHSRRPPPAPVRAGVAYDAGWRQVGMATFPGTQLDPTRWVAYDGRAADPTQNRSRRLLRVGGGVLNLRTSAQMGSGLCWCVNRPQSRYGRWEVRERMSPGADHGEATLLWPADRRWPAGGEIDASEINRADRSLSATTLHYSSANRQVARTNQADFTRWHTFALEWEPHRVTVWRDGVVVFSSVQRSAIPHDPMYLALQAGPNTRRAPPASSVLQVAWVKVFAP